MRERAHQTSRRDTVFLMPPVEIAGLEFQESTKHWTVRVRFHDGTYGHTSLGEHAFTDMAGSPLGQMVLLQWLSQATPEV